MQSPTLECVTGQGKSCRSLGSALQAAALAGRAELPFARGQQSSQAGEDHCWGVVTWSKNGRVTHTRPLGPQAHRHQCGGWQMVFIVDQHSNTYPRFIMSLPSTYATSETLLAVGKEVLAEPSVPHEIFWLPGPDCLHGAANSAQCLAREEILLQSPCFQPCFSPSVLPAPRLLQLDCGGSGCNNHAELCPSAHCPEL